MQELWHTVTSGVAPALTAALVAIIAALTPYIIATLKAKTALLEQAARSAVAHVDAVQEPAVKLSAPEAKALAMKLVADQLPHSDPAKLSKKIDAAVDEKRRSSKPPPPASEP